MALSLMQFAQTYTVDEYLTTTAAPSSDGGGSMFWWFVYLVLLVIGLAACWKIYTKAKQPGWAVLVPIYGTIVELRIINKPWWWILLLLIPVVNIVVGIIIVHRLSLAFGKGVGFTLLLLFLPFIGYPILGFGDAKYKKPA